MKKIFFLLLVVSISLFFIFNDWEFHGLFACLSGFFLVLFYNTRKREKEKKEEKRTTFIFNVNYDDDFEVLKSYYNYDSNISENFTIPTEFSGKKEVTGKIFSFDKKIDSESVASAMEEEGFRPANALEVLFFGREFPLPLLDKIVIALGSCWICRGGHPFVVFVTVRSKRVENFAYLKIASEPFSSECRFLGIEKTE